MPAPDTDEALLAFASNHRVMECSAWLTRCQTTWIAFPAARCGGDNCLYDAASHAFPGTIAADLFCVIGNGSVARGDGRCQIRSGPAQA